MNHSQLLSSAVELGLVLIEKSGDFLPYCKAVNSSGETIVYTPDSASDEGCAEDQASDGIRFNVMRDLMPRQLLGAVFCHHVRIRFSDSAEKVPAVKVELHYRGQPSVVWHFPYKMEGATANVLEYYCDPADTDLFGQGVFTE